MAAVSEAIHMETVLDTDGELVIRGLPFKRAQRVEVIILPEHPIPGERGPRAEQARPPIWRRLAALGADLELPPDLAENHDRYAHGVAEE